MTFNQYLTLETDNTEEIFNYYLDYLESLNSKNFPYNEQFYFQGVIKKFFQCIDSATYLEKEEKENFQNRIYSFKEILRQYNRKNTNFISNIFNSNNKRLFQIQDEFQEIHSMSLKMIDKAKRSIEFRYKHDSLEIDNFYSPKKSNKEVIKSLIREAMDLIKEDNALKDKTKKQLIDYLEKVLKSLDNNYTNWSSVIGNIKEVIIVLAALVAIAEPIASHLSQAKKKLEETDVIIQRTSININYNSINETFNIENVEKLEQFNSNILLLNESNNISEE